MKRIERMWRFAILLCLLNSGCLVLTRERDNKPAAPANEVKIHKDQTESTYYRMLDYPDFNLEVNAGKGPPRWEMNFLLWVVPVWWSSSDDTPIYVRVHFVPKSERVSFNPWQVYFAGFGTNRLRVAPIAVSDNHRIPADASLTSLTTATNTEFTLTFSPWAEMFPAEAALQMELHPNRNLPFELSVEGIRDSGEAVVLPPLRFKPAGRTRAHVQLPY